MTPTTTRSGSSPDAAVSARIQRYPALSAAPQIPEPAQSKVAVESNVVYGKGGDMDLKLDIYRPPAAVAV